MTSIDGLFFIPPVKPIPRPFDLTFSFFDRMKAKNKENIFTIQAGALAVINFLEVNGYNIKFFDFNQFECKESLEETIKNLIQKYDPKIIMAYSYTATIPGLKKALEIFKKINPNIKSIAGGPHVSFLDVETLIDFNGFLDFIVRGEGEKTILELFNSLFKKSNRKLTDIKGITYLINDKILKNEDQMLMSEEELKKLPTVNLKCYPKSEIRNKLLYYAINISRGCPYDCTFCTNPRFWKKLRYLSNKKVIDDINHLGEKYRIIFDFGDSNLAINKKLFSDFVIQYKKDVSQKNNFGMILVRSSLADDDRMRLIKSFTDDHKLSYITIGIENSHPHILKLMKKPNWDVQYNALRKIKQYDLRSIPAWIIGLPGENTNTMVYNLKMLENLNKKQLIDATILSIFTPYPGTPPYMEPEKYGVKIHHYDWEFYDRAVYPPPYSLFDIKTGKISLTSEQIWNYWLLMITTQKKWQSKVTEVEKRNIYFKNFLKMLNENPILNLTNPVEGKINIFNDY